jgi:hypothetical protein
MLSIVYGCPTSPKNIIPCITSLKNNSHSKLEVEFLLNAHVFHTIVMSKKPNHYVKPPYTRDHRNIAACWYSPWLTCHASASIPSLTAHITLHHLIGARLQFYLYVYFYIVLKPKNAGNHWFLSWLLSQSPGVYTQRLPVGLERHIIIYVNISLHNSQYSPNKANSLLYIFSIYS